MANAIIQDILSSFNHSSKSEWEAKAVKDLKGKSLDELSWELNEQIKVSPYYAASDLSEIDNSMLKEYNPDWQIGEDYEINDYKASNKQILDDLMHGLNAPNLYFYRVPSAADLGVLFEGIGLEHIHTHFPTADNELYLSWLAFLKVRGTEAPAYFGLHSPVATLPKSVHINARPYYKGISNVHEELKNTLMIVKAMLSESNDAQLLANQMHFTFYLDNAYLLNIAKLRAFKLLWLECMAHFNLVKQLPFLKVEFALDAYGEDEQDNLIRATSMAMSGALGGANHIIVRPTANSARAKRLARNTQLILKHESGLHQVADPANGSYYIESLTNKLVNYCKELI